MDDLETVADDLSAETSKPQPDAALVRELSAKLAVLRAEEKKFIKKDEVWEIYTRAGADGTNAWTSKDLTTYHLSLPANRVELFCLVESQRMADPVFREFYTERDVVNEERRTRLDTNPDGKLYERFLEAAFQVHPYRITTFGSSRDLAVLSAAQARAFHETYYVPGNAVGVLVGDFKTREVEETVRKYFEGIPAGSPPPAVTVAEPPPTEERRIEVPFDAEPQVLIGYHIPTFPDADVAPLRVLSAILSGGRSSRLYTRLVKNDGLAVAVDTYCDAPGTRCAGLFIVEPTPRAPHPTAEVEAAIYDELERLKNEPVSPEELAKAKNQMDASLLWRLSDDMGLAMSLATQDRLYGDWRHVIAYRKELRAVTAEDLMRVARKYFQPTNRVVATLVKTAEVE
jgi:predicted Zn-dependent peptidase